MRENLGGEEISKTWRSIKNWRRKITPPKCYPLQTIGWGQNWSVIVDWGYPKNHKENWHTHWIQLIIREGSIVVGIFKMKFNRLSGRSSLVIWWEIVALWKIGDKDNVFVTSLIEVFLYWLQFTLQFHRYFEPQIISTMQLRSSW